MKLDFRCSFSNSIFPLFSLFADIRKCAGLWFLSLCSCFMDWTTHCFLTDYLRRKVHRLRNTDLLHSLALRWLHCTYTVLKLMEASVAPPPHPSMVHLLQCSATEEEGAGNPLGTPRYSITPFKVILSSCACTSYSNCCTSAIGAEKTIATSH